MDAMDRSDTFFFITKYWPMYPSDLFFVITKYVLVDAMDRLNTFFKHTDHPSDPFVSCFF